MEKNIREINTCTREIEITLTDAELQPHFDKAYQEALPNIELKGFRKGKVPLNMIKKTYGPKIENDALETISSDTFNSIIKENSIKVIGQPSLIDINKSKEGVTFVVRYEVIPDFELLNYKEIAVNEPVHTVTDEEVEEQIEGICLNSGVLEPGEEVLDNNYIVRLKLYELDSASNVPLIGAKPIETNVFLADKSVLPELRDELLNKKAGDSFTFQPQRYDQHAPDKIYNVVISEINKLIPAEFSNEFVEKYTQGKFQTTEEFREEIGLRMQEDWDEKSRQEVETQIIDTIVAQHEFDVPETIVDNVIHSMIEDIKKKYANTPQAATLKAEEMAPGLQPLAEKTVKWEIIKNKIIDIEKIEVEDYDIDSALEGMPGDAKVDSDTMRSYVIQNKEFMNQLLTKKVIDFLIDFAVTTEISFDEYASQRHEAEHHHDHDHSDHDHEHHHHHGDEEHHHH